MSDKFLNSRLMLFPSLDKPFDHFSELLFAIFVDLTPVLSQNKFSFVELSIHLKKLNYHYYLTEYQINSS